MKAKFGIATVVAALLATAGQGLAQSVPFTEQVIAGDADGAESVFAIDLDGDGDIDVLSASANDDKIAWYENDGGTPPAFTTHVISDTALGARSVFGRDVNGDGFVDVLSASANDDKIAWYENDGGSPPLFLEHILAGDPDQPEFRCDGIGDLCVKDDDCPGETCEENVDAACAFGGGGNSCFEEGDPGCSDAACCDLVCACDSFCCDTAWNSNCVGPNNAVPGCSAEDLCGSLHRGFASGANSVAATDMDGDGDTDILSASFVSDATCDANSPFVGNSCELDSDCRVKACAADGTFDRQCDATDPFFVGISCTSSAECGTGNCVGAGECSDTGAACTSNGQCPTGLCTCSGNSDCLGTGIRVCSAGSDNAGAPCDDGQCPNGFCLTGNGTCIPGPGVCVDPDLDSKVVWYEQCPCDDSIIGTLIGADGDFCDNGACAVGTCSANGLCDDSSCGTSDTIDRWFAYEATCTGTVTATTCSNATDFDTVLSAFAANGTTQLVCNDDDPGALDPLCDTLGIGFNRGSTLQWAATAGTQYRVRVSAFSDAVGFGNFELTVSCSAPDPEFRRHVINLVDAVFNEGFGKGATAVAVADVNGDGAPDVMASGLIDGTLSWYENGGLAGEGDEPADAIPMVRVFAQHVVLDGVGVSTYNSASADFNGDQNNDIVSASGFDLSLAWFDNGGGSVPVMTQRQITATALANVFVATGDIDGDGDPDVVAALSGDLDDPGNQINWYENTGGLPGFGPSPQLVSNNVDQPRSVFTADVDGDGDIDVLAALAGDGKITLYDNGSAPPVFNVTTGDHFGTIASAVAAAAGGHLLSAHPARFDAAEPVIDFQGKGFTLRARGGIHQPAGGVYTLAHNSALEAAPGAWNILLDGELIVPSLATARLSAASFDTSSSGALTASPSSTLLVDVGASLAGSTTLEANAAVTFEGDLVLSGSSNLAAGSSLSANGTLEVNSSGSVTAQGANLSATGSANVDGSVDLDFGSLLIIGGEVMVGMSGDVSVGTDSRLSSVGNATVHGSVDLGLRAVFSTDVEFLVTGQNPLPLGPDASLSAGGNATLNSQTTCQIGASITVGSVLTLPKTGSLVAAENVSIFAGGGIILDGPTSLALAAVLSSGVDIDNNADLEFLGGGITAAGNLNNTSNLTGFGTIDADVFLSKTASALFQADTQVIGDYTNGTPQGCCDDTDPTVAGDVCTNGAQCGVGVCETVNECDASSTVPGDDCNSDGDCTGGLCVPVQKCSAGSGGGLANTVCASDTDCRGICLNAITTITNNGTLVVLGSLTNNGEIVGDVQPPLPRAGGESPTEPDADLNAQRLAGASHGLAVRDHLIIGPAGTLRFDDPLAVVSVGGQFDAALNASDRFDLAQAELKMNGDGAAEQQFEVMSADIGPLIQGFDRTLAGHFPIGTVRIGPTATTVRLVDLHDNDASGQTSPEALYVQVLIVETGATLLTDGHAVYYGTLVLDGTVDDPGNLSQAAPLGDLNFDMTTDLADFAIMQACLAGPSNTGSGGTCSGAQFVAADLDGDDDVDLLDVQILFNLITGG